MHAFWKYDSNSVYSDRSIPRSKITKQVDAAAALLTCIQEVTGSNHERVNDYSKVFRNFPQSLPPNTKTESWNNP
jgi:hypothetical protein